MRGERLCCLATLCNSASISTGMRIETDLMGISSCLSMHLLYIQSKRISRVSLPPQPQTRNAASIPSAEAQGFTRWVDKEEVFNINYWQYFFLAHIITLVVIFNTAGEEKGKEARTPRAPARGLRPPAPPAGRRQVQSILFRREQ